MKQSSGMTLLTKWAFEPDSDMDSLEILCGGDATLDKHSEIDGVAGNDNPVGGWIVESPVEKRMKYGLLDPGTPSIERIARSYQFQKMEPLILF